MKISQKELKKLLIRGAEKIVSKESAEYYADECMETHLRKTQRGSKMNPIKSSITDLLASVENKDNPIQYKNDLGASFVIDFNSHGPLVYIKEIHDKIEEKAKKNGIAMFHFSNSKGIHVLHS